MPIPPLPVALVLLALLALPLQASDTESLSPSDERWVRTTLAGLSLEEKAAQMVMVPVKGLYEHTRSETYRRLLGEVRDLGVGGVAIFDSDLESIPRLLAELQAAATVPLLAAADLERGVAFRVKRGSVPIPYAMALGATRSDEAARFAGELAAREARALGIHWGFAPVVDVNNNPRNPVIHIRSFGEDPELVARLSRAFIEGARAGGLLTTAKHFPGHGDTATDSHFELPVLDVDRARLEAVELVPFRAAIDAGVDAVMVGHVAVPAVDPSKAPATLSTKLTGDLLRRELGFDGLVVTDAMDMGGVGRAWIGGAAVRAVAAGADVVLMPPEPKVAVRALVRAVREGVLDEARLDASVARLLAAKARLGLHRRPTAAPALERVARPEDLERMGEIARASITVVRNRGDVLPLRAEEPLRLFHVMLSSDFGGARARDVLRDELAARRVETAEAVLAREVTAATLDEVVAAAADATHVLVSTFVRPRRSGGLTPSQERLLGRLAAAGKPLVVVSYGSPYLLAEAPELPVYVCAYGAVDSSLQAAVSALFGEHRVTGRLPVSIPGLYPAGHGLELPRREMTLRRARPEEVGFRPGALAEVDRLLAGFVERGAFPGGVVAVGKDGALVHLASFGRLAYDAGAPAVAADTIYDLASLTKVVATTTMAMILVDEGRLDLDAPVSDFLPRFRGGGKDRVTVRHLLTHASGIDWWAPLYEELRGQDAYLKRIQAMDLVGEPGERMLYSDLGLILLGEVLERVAGEPLDAFVARRVFEPLGMRDTLFRPPPALHPRVAPTEDDPWRGRVLRGEVHDENAHALGGVAPHAGLFGTAPDLARFAQMILWGGVYDHHRIVSRPTVELFTRRAGVADSTRALGWDTKSPEGSSAGTLFSPSSFGHTGFTGTSLWIDPERDLFLVLLTNRVHPTRDNQLIREVRPAVADAVVRALGE